MDFNTIIQHPVIQGALLTIAIGALGVVGSFLTLLNTRLKRMIDVQNQQVQKVEAMALTSVAHTEKLGAIVQETTRQTAKLDEVTLIAKQTETLVNTRHDELKHEVGTLKVQLEAATKATDLVTQVAATVAADTASKIIVPTPAVPSKSGEQGAAIAVQTAVAMAEKLSATQVAASDAATQQQQALSDKDKELRQAHDDLRTAQQIKNES